MRKEPPSQNQPLLRVAPFSHGVETCTTCQQHAMSDGKAEWAFVWNGNTQELFLVEMLEPLVDSLF